MENPQIAVWATLVVLIVREALKFVDALRNGGGGSRAEVRNGLNTALRDINTKLSVMAKQIDELVGIHSPDASGRQTWKGVDIVERLLTDRVIPMLDDIKRRQGGHE